MTATTNLTARVVTHHGLEALTAPKTRERWQKGGLLHQPAWVRVDRAQVGFYPELVLARVAIGPKAAPGEDVALDRLCSASEQLCGGVGFRGLLEVAHDALRELRQEWSFGAFVRILAEGHPDVLEQVNGEVRALELELTDEGFVFGAEPGQVVEVDDSRYRVRLLEGELLFPRKCAVEPLDVGAGVVVDRIGVGSVEGRFLLPGLQETLDMIEISVDKEETMKAKELTRLPSRLAAIAERKPTRVRTALGIESTADPREQFSRGFIPALHITGDALPDREPTSALREQIAVPAFR